jgi:hypothetical protein
MDIQFRQGRLAHLPGSSAGVRRRWYAVTSLATAGLALAAATLVPATADAGHELSSGSTTRAVAPPECRSIRAELGRTEAGLGSTYQTIRLRNSGHRTCEVGGFPHIGYVNAHHRLIGWPAAPDRMPHHAHVLKPGQAARTVLQIPSPDNFPPIDCLAHNAHQIRVHTRGATHPSYLRWNQPECTTRFGRSYVFPVRR